MNHNRRAFLRSSSLAALVVALAPGLTFAAGSPAKAKKTARTIPFSPADEPVFDWCASYGMQMRVVGASILGRMRGRSVPTRILVEIPDASILKEVLAVALPFTDAYAKGNEFSFTFEGTRYEVENLLSDAFATRLAKLKKQINFGHEALVYNPATQTLNDPFKVLGMARLKIVRAGAGVAGGFENLLRAWVEANQLGLKRGPQFTRLKQRLLEAPGKRPALAQSVVSSMVARLPQLTDLLTAAQVAALLQSRLVRTAMSRVLGVGAPAVRAQFEALRLASGTDADADAVAWLGGILSKQLEQGIMPDWFGNLDAAAAQRGRAALSRAYWLVRESTPQTPAFN